MKSVQLMYRNVSLVFVGLYCSEKVAKTTVNHEI